MGVRWSAGLSWPERRPGFTCASQRGGVIDDEELFESHFSRRGFLASATVALTIGKVFLVDMSDLTGIFRALSFIGLGAVLVGIGWIYQRMLFPARRDAIRSE